MGGCIDMQRAAAQGVQGMIGGGLESMAQQELRKLQDRYDKLKAGHDAALERLGQYMQAEITKKRKPGEPLAVPELDNLLTVLCRHGVEDYKADEFGLHIKLAKMPPRLEGLKAWLPEDDEPEAPIKTEEPLPPEGAIHPQQMDLEDVLYGAK